MPKVHKEIDGQDREIEVSDYQYDNLYKGQGWEVVDEGPPTDWRGNPIEISDPPQGEVDSLADEGVQPRPQAEKDELKKLGRKEK